MGPLYLGKMGTFVNFRYINNLADTPVSVELECAHAGGHVRLRLDPVPEVPHFAES